MLQRLIEINGPENVLTDEPMKNHTTFRIGGPADYFVTPGNREAIRDTVLLCRREKLPCYLMGNGSNLLVGDLGFRGVILQLQKNWNAFSVDESTGRIRARAGAMLAAVARSAGNFSLTGLEFASGIPGTLGGAVMMNAGAYDGEMKDVVRLVRMMTEDGEYLELSGEEMAFGYRTSIVEQRKLLILEAELLLQKGDPVRIRERMEELRGLRTAKQPLDQPSAGSTFKRPAGQFAGKLIMDAGLRGFRVGGAAVSKKHCGFVVNLGDATAADVLSLMEQVTERVRERFGVTLEPEVKRIGEF